MTEPGTLRAEWEAARSAAVCDDAALVAASATLRAAEDYDDYQAARGQFEAALYDWGRSYDRLRHAARALVLEALVAK